MPRRAQYLRRDDGEGYRELLTRMAQESGIEMPTAEDLPLGRPQVEGQDTAERRLEESTDPEATKICVKGLPGLPPRAIKPRRRAPAAELLES